MPALLRTLVAALLSISFSPAQDKPVDFQRDVRPILSDACYHCHGPDANTRMANLRLDEPNRAVQSAKPAESLLWKRISHANRALRMPPPQAHKDLTAAQQDILRRWLAQGAGYEMHWAFRTPQRPAVPASQNAAWARNPIDAFLLARLQREGLQPAPEADKRTLARRAALDLTGLPPAPELVDAFVADTAPNAYERLVDKLLASPHYGEHRARYWLDAARYADTHGIHVDNYREMWPYRDWVIRAFNANQPFDRFTVEQIAGDLLPNPTPQQLIATGFHRCNITTNEGGSIEDEVAANYAKDRVDTTGAVWLGLTIGCATCHDHKFDPLKQREFYQMAAFFRNLTQKPMDGNIHDTPPSLIVPAASDKPRWDALAESLKQLNEQRATRTTQAQPAFEKWLTAGKAQNLRGPFDKAGARFEWNAAQAADLPANTKRIDSAVPGMSAISFPPKTSITLEKANAAVNPNMPFSMSAWIYIPKTDNDFTIASQLEWTNPDAKVEDDRQRRGWVFELLSKRPGVYLYSGKKRDVIYLRNTNETRLKNDRWYQISITYDGSRRAAGFNVYVDGVRQVMEGDTRFGLGRLEGDITTNAPLRIASDGNKRHMNNGAIAQFQIYDRELTPDEVTLLARWAHVESALQSKQPLKDKDRDTLALYYLRRNDKPFRALTRQFEAAHLEREDIRKRSPVTLVMNERAGSSPFAHVLNRGMYDQPRERVEPGVPSVLNPWPNNAPRNRLGLAQWLVDANNPLTARVTVNRFWQEIFGTAIVRSTEDFGAQGMPPTHPELLDWLAVEFRESGWDVKKLVRLMVTSSAYRQAAVATPEKRQKDPENLLLSRGPRFRMDAEMVRDTALASSGLLVREIGGASVNPYQPTGLWEAVAMLGSNTRFFVQDHGDKLYRRSLYTFWKRSAPPASMDIFGAPTRENCTVRRERTNTPLQALVTLNDVQFVEAARRLAERSLTEVKGPFADRADFMGRQVLARGFRAEEHKVLESSFKDFLRHFDSQPAEAKKLIATGESPVNPKLPVVDLAAWTLIANQVFNLDEALNK